MPSGRVIRYLKEPAIQPFARHVFEETGLTPEHQEMMWTLRNDPIHETEYYADKAGLTKKQYLDCLRAAFPRVMTEVIRLAEVGYKYEHNLI